MLEHELHTFKNISVSKIRKNILQIYRFNETKLCGNGKLWICVEHVEYICPQKDVFLE